MTDGLHRAAEQMQETLACEDQIASLTERYRYMSECFVIARGLNQATAAEAALKMAETCYVSAEAYSAADFLHGPIAVTDEGFPCFLFAADGRTLDSVSDVAGKLRARNAETLVFAASDTILSQATRAVRMPAHVEEIFSPLVYIVAGQLLAYHLALTKGYDPDRPRGLSKVTLTR